jgi:hypothetical protein
MRHGRASARVVRPLPVHNSSKPFLSDLLVRNGPLFLVNIAGATKNAVGGPWRSSLGSARGGRCPPAGAQPVFKYSVPGLLRRSPRRSHKAAAPVVIRPRAPRERSGFEQRGRSVPRWDAITHYVR